MIKFVISLRSLAEAHFWLAPACSGLLWLDAVCHIMRAPNQPLAHLRCLPLCCHILSCGVLWSGKPNWSIDCAFRSTGVEQKLDLTADEYETVRILNDLNRYTLWINPLVLRPCTPEHRPPPWTYARAQRKSQQRSEATPVHMMRSIQQ